MSSLPASIKRIGSKTNEKRWRHHFPHYKPMGGFCCHGNQNFDPICPKTLCSLSPTPVMLHIKFDQDWPNGFRDIQVWKCGRRRRRTTDDDDDGRTTDHWYTISSPCEPSAQVSQKHKRVENNLKQRNPIVKKTVKVKHNSHCRYIECLEDFSLICFVVVFFRRNHVRSSELRSYLGSHSAG